MVERRIRGTCRRPAAGCSGGWGSWGDRCCWAGCRWRGQCAGAGAGRGRTDRAADAHFPAAPDYHGNADTGAGPAAGGNSGPASSTPISLAFSTRPRLGERRRLCQAPQIAQTNRAAESGSATPRATSLICPPRSSSREKPPTPPPQRRPIHSAQCRPRSSRDGAEAGEPQRGRTCSSRSGRWSSRSAPWKWWRDGRS